MDGNSTGEGGMYLACTEQYIRELQIDTSDRETYLCAS